MITVKAIERVADGGVCNSGAAVDLAKVTHTALVLCTQVSQIMTALKAAEGARTFTTIEVHNILANMMGPLDTACANAVDTGDGRTIKQVYDEDKANGEVPE